MGSRGGALGVARLPMRLTAIRLRSGIVVGPGATDARPRQLVELAQRECDIANSLTSEIAIEPRIGWGRV